MVLSNELIKVEFSQLHKECLISLGRFVIKNYYCSPLVITAHISLLTTWSDLDTERAVIWTKHYRYYNQFSPNLIYRCLEWLGIVKSSTGKRKKPFTFVLPNFDPCIYEIVRAKLSVLSGLKWGKFLFPYDAFKYCSSFQTLLPVELIRESTW